MCCKESFIVFVYLAGMLIQNDRVFAQHSNDPCLYHDVMDSEDRVRYANSITRPSCPGNTVNEGWYRFGTTGAGEITTSCPTGNQCGGGNRIWINGSVPVRSDGIHSRVACVQKGSSCCSRTLPVSMKYCGSYFIYYIGQFPSCSTICLAQTTTNVIVNPTSAATMVAQNTVTTSSMTNTYPTDKDPSILITIIVVVVVVIILALLAVFVILLLRRWIQQNVTNKTSTASSTRDDTSYGDESRLEDPASATFSNAGYTADENLESDTHDPETHTNVDINLEAVYEEISVDISRPDQQNGTNEDSPTSPTSGDVHSSVVFDTNDGDKNTDQIQLENLASATFSNADTEYPETHTNVDINLGHGYENIPFDISRRVQQNGTNGVVFDTNDGDKNTDQIQLEVFQGPTSATFSNAVYSVEEHIESNTQDPETHSNVHINLEDGYQKTSVDISRPDQQNATNEDSPTSPKTGDVHSSVMFDPYDDDKNADQTQLKVFQYPTSATFSHAAYSAEEILESDTEDSETHSTVDAVLEDGHQETSVDNYHNF